MRLTDLFLQVPAYMADHPTFTLVAAVVVGLLSFCGYRAGAR